MDSIATLGTRVAFDSLALSGSPRLSILIFHRVHRCEDEIFPGEMDAKYFDRLMSFVARSFQVLTLGSAIEGLTNNTLPRRSLVITFDDGYADNAEVALPILNRHGLKASFFVSTGFLNGGRMWNDTVIECIRNCEKDAIDLGAFGLGRHTLRNLVERRHAMEILLSKIKYLDLSGRVEACAMLQQITGARNLSSRLMMTSHQVRELHAAGMEIGAHTVNHPILTAIEDSQAEQELKQGKQELERILDARVDVLAYPNGKPGLDFDSRHVAMTKQLGFRGAVTTAPGAAMVGDDLFQLPRFTPWNKNLARWATSLWLNQRKNRIDRVETRFSI